MKDRFLRALHRQPIDRTPVWIMRQAGRYLPEYRQTRKKAGNFLTLCKTPNLACEVTLQPLRRFPLDAAIIFSDILTIPDAMGLGLTLEEGLGPRFENPLTNESLIEKLPRIDPEKELSYVIEAIKLTKKNLSDGLPLIGFAGSPWTLAAYMVEGQSSRDFPAMKKLIYSKPDIAHELLGKMSDAVADFLIAQISAGVDAVMIFDTWGWLLSHQGYIDFSLNYIKKVISAIEATNCPSIVFTKGGGLWLENIATSGCNAIGLDWTIDISDARKRIGSRTVLQGNIDPSVLLGHPDTIRQSVRDTLDNFGHGGGHILNLGHGITPNVPPDNVDLFVRCCHEFSKQYHS